MPKIILMGWTVDADLDDAGLLCLTVDHGKDIVAENIADYHGPHLSYVFEVIDAGDEQT